jgi:hypothetical protein
MGLVFTSLAVLQRPVAVLEGQAKRVNL